MRNQSFNSVGILINLNNSLIRFQLREYEIYLFITIKNNLKYFLQFFKNYFLKFFKNYFLKVVMMEESTIIIVKKKEEKKVRREILEKCEKRHVLKNGGQRVGGVSVGEPPRRGTLALVLQ